MMGAALTSLELQRALISLGLVAEHELGKLAEAQIPRFIFTSGFSTADRVTNVSGRGIGMDVVRANIGSIGGTIDVSSSRGRGTVFTIKIPLTLAIVSAFIVGVAGSSLRYSAASGDRAGARAQQSELSIEHIKDSTAAAASGRAAAARRRCEASARDHTTEPEPRRSAFIIVMQDRHADLRTA